MRTSFLALVALACLGLEGCAVGKTWHALEDIDEFADAPVNMVTIGNWKAETGGWLFTSSFHYYPFVGLKDGELIVGIRSGGRYRTPAAAVQIRIDGNKTWSISPEETPVYLIPGQAASPVAAPKTDLIDTSTPQGKAVADSMAVAKAMMEETHENMQGYLGKTLSPFTAATGDKAKSIIKEMLSGKKMIYRTVGYNQANSTKGEVLLDASFTEAMGKIGITKEMLNSAEAVPQAQSGKNSSESGQIP